MKPLIPLVSALALALAFAAPALAQPAGHMNHHPATLVVTGEGRASAAPDLALIRIGVETRAETAEAAMAENARQAGAVIEAAKARGVAAKDIQTSDLSIWPVYEDYRSGEARPPKLVGFQVSNQVSVRLRDLAAAGEAIGALVSVGANRMNGIDFGFADDGALRDEARRRAVADAKRKAELYAEAAGVRLGPIKRIEEAGFVSGPRPMMRAAAMMDEAAAPPIEAGESEISASVSIVWEIDAPE